MSLAKNIFLSDDDPEDRDLFQEALCEVSDQSTLTTSTNGIELLTQLQNPFALLPDVIFLDINMPEKNGIETLKEIKSDKVLSAIPVVMYSTGRDENQIEAVYCLGANRYVVKPADYSVLKKRITQVLSINWEEEAFPAMILDFVI